MKNRFDGELGIMPLRFNKDTSSYVPQEVKKGAVKSERSKNETEARDENENLEDLEEEEEKDNPSKTEN